MERFHYDREKEYEFDEIKPLFRGVWADRLVSGQELPIIGSQYSESQEPKLELDFASFEDELGGFTSEDIAQYFADNEALYREYVESFDSDIDPYIHFACAQVQHKINRLLDVDVLVKTDPAMRDSIYASGTPKLSDLKGNTLSAERAALAQYILQKIGIESAYVSGVVSPDDDYAHTEDHSFVVIRDGGNSSRTFVFDVACPHEESGVPSLFETDEPYTYDTIAGIENKLVGASEVLLQDQRIYVGVGGQNVS